MIEWQDLHHSQLTLPTLYALLALRNEVFVVEQNCPYQDIDGNDLAGDNRHLLGWHDQRLSPMPVFSNITTSSCPSPLGALSLHHKHVGTT